MENETEELNFEEALAKLCNEGPFDAVVTDYNMPKMDGRELCESIRERFAGDEIFVFLVTARLEDPLREWATGLPKVEYLEKPLSLQDLLGRLAKMFARVEGSRQVEEQEDD